MPYYVNKVSYVRVDDAYDLVYDHWPIARLMRVTAFARPFSKSNMSTGHVQVWRATLDGVDGLDVPDHARLGRELRQRDKKTRRAAAEHVLATYGRLDVALPNCTAASAA